jgi:hypothetical protein
MSEDKIHYFYPCSPEEALKGLQITGMETHNQGNANRDSSDLDDFENGILFDERDVKETRKSFGGIPLYAIEGKIGLLLDDHSDDYEQVTIFDLEDGSKAYRVVGSRTPAFWCKEIPVSEISEL